VEKKFAAAQTEQATSRRDFLKSSALSIAAASVTSLASQTQAQTPPAQPAPPRALGGSASGTLFVETD
jgi:TAT (twin-arginine translocation) pathway signal sequence